jgi:hypothetical protein
MVGSTVEFGSGSKPPSSTHKHAHTQKHGLDGGATAATAKPTDPKTLLKTHSTPCDDDDFVVKEFCSRVKAPSRQRDCHTMKIDMTTMDPERMKKVWFHAHALAHVFYLLSLSVSLSHLS